MRPQLPLGLIFLLTACDPAVPKVGDGALPTNDTGTDGGGNEGSDGADGSDGGDGSDGNDGGDGSDGSDGGGPVDADGDGYTDEEDCNDSDASVNPGAEEVAEDEVDNDCDEMVDELLVCEGALGDIQAAIDASPDGGGVEICPGTWPGNLDLGDREITLVGIEGAADTIILADVAGTPVLSLGNNAKVRLIGLTFTGGSAEQGAGIFCSRGDLNLESVTVSGNTSTGDGGGLYANNCDITVETSVFEANTSGGYGGGASLANSRGTFSTSTSLGNVALEGGGLFISGGSVDVVGNRLEANQAIGASEEIFAPGGGGGGLWTSGSDTIDGNEVIGNSSNYNGGGVVLYGSSPTFSNNRVEANISGEDGGGVYCNQIGGTIEANVITGNEAADDAGGLRLYIGSAEIIDNVITFNRSGDDGGGAKMSHSTHVFRGNVLEDNEAGDAGGGLELDNDSSEVTDSEFRRNRSYRGAGLHNWRTERPFNIHDSIFEENVAGDCGGGMSFDNSPHLISLRRLEFHGNQAGDGAGICVDLIYRDPEDVGGVEGVFEVTEIDLANSLFVGNAAGDEGGAIYAKAAEMVIHNILADDNSGSGAVAVKGANVELINTIIVDQNGPAVYAAEIEELPTSFTVSYSDLWDNESNSYGIADPVGSDGNISEDPDLDADYQLGSSSPCVDAGDPGIRDADRSRSDMGYFGGPDAP